MEDEIDYYQFETLEEFVDDYCPLPDGYHHPIDNKEWDWDSWE